MRTLLAAGFIDSHVENQNVANHSVGMEYAVRSDGGTGWNAASCGAGFQHGILIIAGPEKGPVIAHRNRPVRSLVRAGVELQLVATAFLSGCTAH